MRISCVCHRLLEESQAILLYGKGAFFFFLHMSLFSGERSRDGDMPKSLRDGKIEKETEREIQRKREERERERERESGHPLCSSLQFVGPSTSSTSIATTRGTLSTTARRKRRVERIATPSGLRVSPDLVDHLSMRGPALFGITATTSPSSPGSVGVKTLN